MARPRPGGGLLAGASANRGRGRDAGEPLSDASCPVVGFELSGALRGRDDRADLVLTVTGDPSRRGLVGKCGRVLGPRPRGSLSPTGAPLGNMSPGVRDLRFFPGRRGDSRLTAPDWAQRRRIASSRLTAMRTCSGTHPTTTRSTRMVGQLDSATVGSVARRPRRPVRIASRSRRRRSRSRGADLRHLPTKTAAGARRSRRTRRLAQAPGATPSPSPRRSPFAPAPPRPRACV